MIAIGIVLLVMAVALVTLGIKFDRGDTERGVTLGDVAFYLGVFWLIVGMVIMSIGLVRAEEPQGAHPRLSKQGCDVTADMVLVARSLSAAGVERGQAAEIMALVYAQASDDGGEIDRLRGDLTDFAYRREEIPVDLGNAFRLLCYERSGALDAILGSPVRWKPQ